MLDGSIKVSASPDVVPSHEYLTSTTAVNGVGLRIGILHNALRKALPPLIDHGEKGFPVQWCHRPKLQCFLALIYYFCDIP